jgi:signal transduction histidine kinase
VGKVVARDAPQRLGFAAIAVTVVAVVCAVAAVVLVVVAAPAGERGERGLLEALVVSVPLAAGLATMTSAGDRRFSLMLVGAGIVWSLTALGESSHSVTYSIGRIAAWLIFPLLVYLMLAFPNGRLESGVDRRLFGAVAVIIAVLYIGSALFVAAYPEHLPWATCDTDCPPNAFLILDHEPAFMADVVAPLREAIGGVALLAVSLRLVLRTFAASPLRRRVLAPVAFMSVISTLTLILYLIVRRTSADAETIEAIGMIWSLTVPAVAAAFLVGLLRRQAMAAETLARASLALGERQNARELRRTLAGLLDDPSLEVLVPDDAPGRWRDSRGRLTTPSAAASGGRTVTMIGDESGTVAALAHDPALDEDEALVEAVSALVLATIRHQRALTELEVSRKRIARAADLERSRIERDLHDGAQQRLIGLRIKLSLAEEIAHADPAAGVQAIHELGDEVERTLEELRSLAHGVYPALLSDRGLGDALRGVLAQSPVPVHLVTHHLSRYPPEVETAVYFTCLEAVQNAFKHGQGATGLWLTVHEDAGLRFEVLDDGVGFAPHAGEGNGGLRNMRDRVEAIGGRLTIESSPGEGARVRGVVPLA